MSYRYALIRRWSRRDRLAVVMIALTVAFLTGSTLLIVAASAQPIGLADEFRSSGTATILDSTSAPTDETVLPLATATREDGTDVTVIGVPTTAAESWNVPPPPDDGFVHGHTDVDSVQVTGNSGSVEGPVYQEPAESLLPADWYVTTPETVADLGATESLVLSDNEEQAPEVGVPFRSALGFFLTGQSQLLGLMGAVISGGAVLVAITVYSITRMSVRDRLATIRTARATGATPRTILGIFALRASLLTAVGISLGYALGVILPNTALSVAVFLGLPTALNLGATTQALFVLIPSYIGLVLLGALAGTFAAWSATRGSPIDLSTTTEGSRTSRLALLDWQTLVPTTATLTVFMSVLFVISALTLTAAPVATTDGSTITQPGSDHPINSQVPAEYADALQSDGINASAEIMGFAVVDGQPFLTRGAEYDSFAAVTDAELTEGRMHESADEAVIGGSLAQTLDVEVGETLTLGGSVEDGVTRVTIVGAYTAPGALEDQLLLSLSTAQQLSNVGTDSVNVIRTEEALSETDVTSSVTVLEVSAPERALANDSVEVTATLRNHESTQRSHTITAALGEEEVEEELTLEANEQQTVQLTIPTADPSSETLQVNEEHTSPIEIIDPETPQLDGVPAEAPPGSEPLISVQTPTGEPLANTAVSIDGETVETGSDGSVRLPVGSAGTREISVTTDQGTATETIDVTTDAEREPVTSIDVIPSTPTPLTAPTAQTTFYNPWNEPLETSVRISGPETTVEESLQLDAGERTELQTELTRQPPGTYTVEVSLSEIAHTETSYEVSGDERAAAALASGGYASDSGGLDQAIEAAVGNITLLLVALGGLAATMTVGGLSASMARAVHDRRQTIGTRRAVGASPRDILQTVLRDAFVIGMVGTVGAFVASLLVMQLLDFLGLLTIYGINIPPVPPLQILLTAGITGIGLTLCSTAIAVSSLLWRPPAGLLSGESRVAMGGDSRDG